jgi:TPR repeat protein
VVALFGIAYEMTILHRRGIIRRDLTPGTVFVNGEREATIADFGTLQFAEAFQTGELGTALYGAPEIWRDEEGCDFPAGVYAYAVPVYPMISGLSPFEELKRGTKFQVRAGVLAGERPVILAWLEDSPWRGLIESCWTQELGNRITFEGVVRAMGRPTFVGPRVDVDRPLDYHERVATPDFPSRAGCELKGSGLPKSPFELLIAAADSGDALSQTTYGYRSYVGDGVPQDFEKAANYFKMAADQGHAVGQYNYGVCLRNGHGVARDLVKAAEYYKMAADQGHAGGKCGYGFCLQNGLGAVQDFVKAAEYYKMAADQGHAGGQNNYGLSRQNGRGVANDFVKPAEYFKIAADQGHADGEFNYGVCLEQGLGVTQDFAKAARYYKMAADHGHARGQYNYGVCLRNGNGVARDSVEAAKYYKMAGDQVDAAGQYNYGICLHNGLGVSRDLLKATEYYKMAADQGHADATQSLRRLTQASKCSVA